jgi:dTDP-4-amino-4,6-dideoxygalactose transaminase
LGGIGHLGAFSFHETKNIISGEGGLLIVNDEKLLSRAEVVWEKGTNRASFFRGEINKYGWVDIGSSFLPSETIAAFLYAQLEKLDFIQKKRLEHWNQYYERLYKLHKLKKLLLPNIPKFATNNAHMFFVICNSQKERSALINVLKKEKIHSVFHYLSLHKSEYYLKSNELVNLPNADKYSNRLLRLPMFFELTSKEIERITSTILSFYNE